MIPFTWPWKVQINWPNHLVLRTSQMARTSVCAALNRLSLAVLITSQVSRKVWSPNKPTLSIHFGQQRDPKLQSHALWTKNAQWALWKTLRHTIHRGRPKIWQPVWPSPRPVPHHALPTYLSPNLTPCPVISTRASSNPINDRWDISRTLIGVHLVTWRRKVVGRATVTDDPPIPQPTIGIRPNGCPHIPICPLPSHGTRRRGTDPAPIIRGHRSQWSTSDNSETLAGARWTTHK